MILNSLTSYLIGALLVVGAFTGTYFWGKHVTQVEWDIANAKTEQEIKILKEQAGRITTVIETKYVDRIKVIKEKGDAIIHYVPTYINAEANANCNLPNGYVRLFNAASQNVLPGAPNETDAAPSGIALTDATATTVYNFNTCHIYKARAEELMNWITEQRQLNP